MNASILFKGDLDGGPLANVEEVCLLDAVRQN